MNRSRNCGSSVIKTELSCQATRRQGGASNIESCLGKESVSKSTSVIRFQEWDILQNINYRRENKEDHRSLAQGVYCDTVLHQTCRPRESYEPQLEESVVTLPCSSTVKDTPHIPDVNSRTWMLGKLCGNYVFQ